MNKAAANAHAIVHSQGGTRSGHPWDGDKHPRVPKGSGDPSGEFAPKGGSEAGCTTGCYNSPQDALHSLINGEKVNIQPGDVQRFLELAARYNGDPRHPPDLTDVHVNGMLIFGGDGLGIRRHDMPQVPKNYRDDFIANMQRHGVSITREMVNPLSLRPSQMEVNASKVGQMIQKYEADPHRPFPAVLIAKDGYILDGHHHWGTMAALAVDTSVKMPVVRLHVGHAKALQLMHEYDRQHNIQRLSISGDFAGSPDGWETTK
jgi:hypothetical protein